MKYCEKCGRQIENERFCPGCGTEIRTEMPQQPMVDNIEDTNSYSAAAETVLKKPSFNISKLPKKILIAVGAGIVAIIILIISVSNAGPNFKKIYKKHCSPLWAEVGSDGSYLYIDTNPDDEEDNGIAYYESYSAVDKVNKELKLPDSLFSDMGSTTGNDGKQTEEFDKIIVSWKYHPDKGLEVMYKKK